MTLAGAGAVGMTLLAPAQATGNGAPVRYPLFSDELQDYFWSYDNAGLRVLQLRFYGAGHNFHARPVGGHSVIPLAFSA